MRTSRESVSWMMAGTRPSADHFSAARSEAAGSGKLTGRARVISGDSCFQDSRSKGAVIRLGSVLLRPVLPTELWGARLLPRRVGGRGSLGRARLLPSRLLGMSRLG